VKYLKTFVSAIIAGMCIGMGGIVFLSLENKIAGAFFFTTGCL
jgi:formate/nitrite transporter FocA (FNT family)